MTQLAQNKVSHSFLIEFFRAFFRSNVHFRTLAFRGPFARANRTQSTLSVSQTGTPIQPYATEFQPLNMIQPNKILIGTQNTSPDELTCTKQITSHFLIGTKNGFFCFSRQLFASSPAQSTLRRQQNLDYPAIADCPFLFALPCARCGPVHRSPAADSAKALRLSVRAASSVVNERLSMFFPLARFTRARSSSAHARLLEFPLTRAKSAASKFLIDNFHALFRTPMRSISRVLPAAAHRAKMLCTAQETC